MTDLHIHTEHLAPPRPRILKMDMSRIDAHIRDVKRIQRAAELRQFVRKRIAARAGCIFCTDILTKCRGCRELICRFCEPVCGDCGART